MDEYKHSEKRALCTSCHDYTNVRAPLLRGNSYQEEAIVEEEHGNDNEATNEVVVEVHCSSTSSSNNSENQSNSSQTFVNMDNEIRCNTDNREKCGCESENIDSNIHQVNIELSEEVGRIVSENKTVDNDLKQTNEEVQKKQDIQLTCNGKNGDAFIIETQTKENFGIVHKGDESDITQNNQGNSTEGMDHLITDVNKEFKPKDVETKGKNVHELTHMFEHVEDLLKTKHNNDEDGSNESRGSSKDQEDLDNSFEREFKDSCKEIINSARNSIAKEFQLNKDLDTLKSFNSESTLQLSDVETENCQYDVSSYVNINTCRTTNL